MRILRNTRRRTTTRHANQNFEVEVTLRYITPDNYEGAIIKIKEVKPMEQVLHKLKGEKDNVL